MQESAKKTISDAPIQREYFFPHHSKAITASSQEEALKKLAEIKKSEDINHK